MRKDYFLSAGEVAERLGISHTRVTFLIRAGRLPAVKIGNYWAVRREDLKELHRLSVGRPKNLP